MAAGLRSGREGDQREQRKKMIGEGIKVWFVRLKRKAQQERLTAEQW